MRTVASHRDCKIEPCWLEPFLLQGLGPSSQDRGDAIVASVWEKQAQGLGAYGKTTDACRAGGRPGYFPSQGLCLPGLTATKPTQTKSQGGKAASRAVADSTGVCSSSRPPAEDCIVRENILLPDGRLPQRPDNLVHLPEWAVFPPALRNTYTDAAVLAARPAPVRRDVGVGTSAREENLPRSFGVQRSAGKRSRQCEQDQDRQVLSEHRPRGALESWCSKAGNREEKHGAVNSSSRPPAEDCIVRENILLPDGRLPQRPDNLVPLPEWAVFPPGLREITKELPGQTPSKRRTGKPSQLPEDEQRLQVQRECRPLRVENRASTVGKREEKHGAVNSSSRPPAEDCIVRENILLPDGRLPQRPDNLVPLPEWAVFPPALHNTYTDATVVAARPAPVRRDVGVRSSAREENSPRSFGAQRSVGKESRQTLPPELGTVVHDNIWQTDKAIHWWQQKAQHQLDCPCIHRKIPKSTRQ
ncbi:uncharacterized protein LOC110390358 [Numida meleagris]|uniref:uncharacterized protein LOC110390358 n=1 Tax=Numida meleagris TaxID=8996 RepID=UPI000B3E1BB9|nr:uncharacterized protein LOC110390358 [Numida meleagris]